jgi:hypothetical protein
VFNRNILEQFDIEDDNRYSLVSTSSSTKNEDGGHYKYSHPIEYWLVTIGLAIGYGSFWRFPFLVYTCGYKTL